MEVAYGRDKNRANSSLVAPDEIPNQSVQSQISSDIHGLQGDNNVSVLEDNSLEDTDLQESTAEVQEQQEEQVVENEDRGSQQSASVGSVEVRSDAGDSEGILEENSPEILGNEGGQGQLQEAQEVSSREQLEPSRREDNAHDLSVNTNELEGDRFENINLQNTIAQVEEWQEQFRENEEASESEGHDFEEEAHDLWHEDSSQEVLENWLEGPSDRETVLAERVDRYYFPDDDNVYNTELRELLSRYHQPYY